MVRILEGGKKIVSKEANFYDKELLSAITGEAQKLGRYLQHVLGKMKIKTGDAFLVWRLRELAAQGNIELSGDWNKGWKEIQLKTASAPAATPSAE